MASTDRNQPTSRGSIAPRCSRARGGAAKTPHINQLCISHRAFLNKRTLSTVCDDEFTIAAVQIHRSCTSDWQTDWVLHRLDCAFRHSHLGAAAVASGGQLPAGHLLVSSVSTTIRCCRHMASRVVLSLEGDPCMPTGAHARTVCHEAFRAPHSDGWRNPESEYTIVEHAPALHAVLFKKERTRGPMARHCDLISRDSNGDNAIGMYCM